MTDASNLFYIVRMWWNGTLVLDGKCSMVAGYDTAQAFIKDNFAGMPHKGYCEDIADSLNILLEEGSIAFEYRDATGHAHAVVRRI